MIVQHPETVGHGPQLFQTFTVHRFPVTKVCNSECRNALLVRVILMAFYVALVCIIEMNIFTRFTVKIFGLLKTVHSIVYQHYTLYIINISRLYI